MTGRPLEAQAKTPGARALDLAPTDSLTGHLNNALAILELAGTGSTVYDHALGHVVPARAYDETTLADLEVRIRAALVLLLPGDLEPPRSPRFAVTPTGYALLDLEREV